MDNLNITQNQTTSWTNAAWDFAKPPLAAAGAIIPAHYGFVVKSAQQLEQAWPSRTLWQALQGGIKSSPVIGAIVGTQMVSQNLVEGALTKLQGEPNWATMLLSSAIVGGLSAPGYAIFTGQTTGLSMLESLKVFDSKQTAAVVARETSFVLSLRVSDHVSKVMGEFAGDSKPVELASAFVTGALGSAVGHPADTAFTRWQNGLPVSFSRQLMRGILVKSATTGFFAVLYKLGKEALSPGNNNK